MVVGAERPAPRHRRVALDRRRQDSRDLGSILTTVSPAVRTVSASREMKPLQEPPRQDRQPPGHDSPACRRGSGPSVLRSFGPTVSCTVAWVCVVLALTSNPSVAWFPRFSKPIKSALSSSKPNVAAVSNDACPAERDRSPGRHAGHSRAPSRPRLGDCWRPSRTRHIHPPCPRAQHRRQPWRAGR